MTAPAPHTGASPRAGSPRRLSSSLSGAGDYSEPTLGPRIMAWPLKSACGAVGLGRHTRVSNDEPMKLRVARARAERQGNHSKAARCIACTLLRWAILTIVSVLLGVAVAVAVGWAVVWFVVVGIVRVIVGMGL